jgi:transcription elongation factor Elf1
MKIKKTEWVLYEMIHYAGSLDFSCDFCKSNSYNNIHFEKDGHLLFVVCKDCIDSVMKELR